MLSTGTDAKDPDELLKREGGVRELESIIDKAVDPLTLLFQRVRTTLDGQGVSAQSRIVEEFLNRLVDLGLRPVDREMRYQLIVKRLAAITGIEWSAISASLSQRLGAQRRRPAPGSGTPSSDPQRPSSTEQILGCILCHPPLLLGLDPAERSLLNPESLPPGSPRAVARAIAEVSSRGDLPDLQSVLRELEDLGAQQAATAMARAVERLTGAVPERMHAHLQDCLEKARRDGLGADAVEDAPGAPFEPFDEDGWAPPDDHPTLAPPFVVAINPEIGKLQRIVDMQRQLGENPRAVPKPMTG